MARIPYADSQNPAVKPLADRIVAERGEVLHLYRMLLNSPPVAEGWLTYLTAIRQKSSLSGAIREMVIMRVAQLNHAPYEADQHAPIALKEGMSQPQLDALADWAQSDLFSERERAVLLQYQVISEGYDLSGVVEASLSCCYRRASLQLKVRRVHSVKACICSKIS